MTPVFFRRDVQSDQSHMTCQTPQALELLAGPTVTVTIQARAVTRLTPQQG